LGKGQSPHETKIPFAEAPGESLALLESLIGGKNKLARRGEKDAGDAEPKQKDGAPGQTMIPMRKKSGK